MENNVVVLIEMQTKAGMSPTDRFRTAGLGPFHLLVDVVCRWQRIPRCGNDAMAVGWVCVSDAPILIWMLKMVRDGRFPLLLCAVVLT